MFNLVASGSVAAADLGDEPLSADSITLSPGHIEQLPAFAPPPQKAYDLLKRLKEQGGIPLAGYVGGRDFQNRERRLPRGSYREYDVNRKVRSRGRDAERIVIEQRTGKAYYTGDHYRTFVPLN
jgi:ribonuclease T1